MVTSQPHEKSNKCVSGIQNISLQIKSKQTQPEVSNSYAVHTHTHTAMVTLYRGF